MKNISASETEKLKEHIKQLEAKLRESESLYRSVLNLSLDGIVIVNAEGVLLDVNKRFCDWTGFSREELLASPPMRPLFLPPESREMVIDAIKRRLSGEEVPPYELPFATKSGDIVLGEIHAVVMYDSLGIAVADMVIIRDVTKRKKA